MEIVICLYLQLDLFGNPVSMFGQETMETEALTVATNVTITIAATYF